MDRSVARFLLDRKKSFKDPKSMPKTLPQTDVEPHMRAPCSFGGW